MTEDNRHQRLLSASTSVLEKPVRQRNAKDPTGMEREGKRMSTAQPRENKRLYLKESCGGPPRGRGIRD